ncbi:unnamed protein product [Gadus morhua 'NCC']
MNAMHRFCPSGLDPAVSGQPSRADSLHSVMKCVTEEPSPINTNILHEHDTEPNPYNNIRPQRRNTIRRGSSPSRTYLNTSL